MDPLYLIAQQITDEVLGKGAYKKLNKFDPSKGETYAQLKEPTRKVRRRSKKK